MKSLLKRIKSFFSKKEEILTEDFIKDFIKETMEKKEAILKELKASRGKLNFIENANSDLQVKIINEPDELDGIMEMYIMLGIDKERAFQLEEHFEKALDHFKRKDAINVGYMLEYVSSICKHPNELAAICMIIGMYSVPQRQTILP